MNENIKTIIIDENEHIDVIKIEENQHIKNTNLKSLLKGEPGANYMIEIDLSTDPENPTDISQYFEKSGTYVAKNTGIIHFLEVGAPMAKGGFFTVQNFKNLASQLGVEVPDEENEIKVNLSLCIPGLTEDVVLKKIGNNDWIPEVNITNENADDYLDLDIDVSSEVQQILRNAVNSNYGMQLIGNYLSFVSASNSDIDSVNTPYRVITPNNIKYAIEKWGAEYYASKQGHENLTKDVSTLEKSMNTLITEIETILESVVVIDE